MGRQLLYTMPPPNQRGWWQYGARKVVGTFSLSRAEMRVGPIPSSIPSPERRIGMSEMVSGATIVVVYSNPRGVVV